MSSSTRRGRLLVRAETLCRRWNSSASSGATSLNILQVSFENSTGGV